MDIPEYYQLFTNGIKVYYCQGWPYQVDRYGNYNPLDPYEYGCIDQDGYLYFPAPAITEEKPQDDLRYKRLLLTFLLGGSLLMLSGKGDGIINRALSMFGQYREGSSLALGNSLNIPYLYPAVQELAPDIVDLASYFVVDPNIIAITIQYESGGDASNDPDMIDVGVGQMTEPTLDTMNRYSTPEQRAYIGLPDGRYATMADLINNKRIATGYTALLYRFYVERYGVTDPGILARMYNGGPGAQDGPTTQLNAKYSEDVGGLVNEVGLGMNGHTIQRLIESGRFAAPQQ